MKRQQLIDKMVPLAQGYWRAMGCSVHFINIEEFVIDELMETHGLAEPRARNIAEEVVDHIGDWKR